MSHHDKKFENESQDARRRDQHNEIHSNDKQKKPAIKPADKEAINRKK